MLTMLLVFALMGGAFLSRAEDDVPVSLVITVPSDIKLETAGTLDSLTFTLLNETDEPYTLHHARLSGGFDEEIRALNDVITLEANSTREFSLSNVFVSDEQLDQEIVYTLSWDEMVIREATEKISESIDQVAENYSGEEDEEEAVPVEETGIMSETENLPESLLQETEPEFIPRSIEASIKIERFVPPELNVSVKASAASAAEGDTFSITYTISNNTKYDMSGIMLTDAGVYDGAIPIPATELTAGDSITVTIDYTMGDQDMVFHPTVSYVAAQRQFESRLKEPVIIGSVVTAIKIDVEQYPSNVEGSTFAITVTNIGNRTLTRLQLYDEINTEIDRPFDLSAQQQKVITFNVPSAYSAGLIRTVRFRVTGYDYFGDPFSYTDVNSYECIPYITSDEVRLSVLATLRNAYYDDSGKLCGEILLEIRNYSDVRLTNAVLSELTLFGPLETYRELLRGETYHTVTFQLDDVAELQFCATANDPTGRTYTSEIIRLNLDQLESLASKPEGQQVVYHSNTFLKDLVQKVAGMFRNAFFAAFILVLVSTTICLILWFLEEKLKSRLPSESLMHIVVPEAKTPKTSMDQVLNSSPAEQLGYTVPAKIRYGATTIKTSSNGPEKTKRFGSDVPFGRNGSNSHAAYKRPQPKRIDNSAWSKHNDASTAVFVMDQSQMKPLAIPSPQEKKPSTKEVPTLSTDSEISPEYADKSTLYESNLNKVHDPNPLRFVTDTEREIHETVERKSDTQISESGRDIIESDEHRLYEAGTETQKKQTVIDEMCVSDSEQHIPEPLTAELDEVRLSSKETGDTGAVADEGTIPDSVPETDADSGVAENNDRPKQSSLQTWAEGEQDNTSRNDLDSDASTFNTVGTVTVRVLDIGSVHSNKRRQLPDSIIRIGSRRNE